MKTDVTSSVHQLTGRKVSSESSWTPSSSLLLLLLHVHAGKEISAAWITMPEPKESVRTERTYWICFDSRPADGDLRRYSPHSLGPAQLWSRLRLLQWWKVWKEASPEFCTLHSDSVFPVCRIWLHNSRLMLLYTLTYVYKCLYLPILTIYVHITLFFTIKANICLG